MEWGAGMKGEEISPDACFPHAKKRPRFSDACLRRSAMQEGANRIMSDASMGAPTTIAARLRSLGISRRRPLTVTPYLFDWFQYMLIFADCQLFYGTFWSKTHVAERPEAVQTCSVAEPETHPARR